VIGMLKQVTTVTLPLLGDIRAWQVTFLIVGLPGLLIALLFMLTVRDPQRKGALHDAAGLVQRVSMADALRFIGSHGKTFSCHYLGFSFYAMTLFCLMGWTPAFYIRHFGFTPMRAGYTLGTILLLSNTAGVLAGGWLSDFLLKRGRTDAPMLAAVVGAAGMLIPAVAFTLVDSLNMSLGLLVLAMFFASFPMPTSTAAMQMLAPNQMRAQVSALFLLISNLIALGIGTTLVALLTDRWFGTPKAVGESMAVVNAVATLAAVALLWLGCRHFRLSLQRKY